MVPASVIAVPVGWPATRLLFSAALMEPGFRCARAMLVCSFLHLDIPFVESENPLRESGRDRCFQSAEADSGSNLGSLTKFSWRSVPRVSVTILSNDHWRSSLPTVLVSLLAERTVVENLRYGYRARLWITATTECHFRMRCGCLAAPFLILL